MAEPTGTNDALGQAEGEPRAGAPEAATRVVRRKRSMWEDRRVRTMAYAAAAVVVLYLLTVISALFFGFINPSAPRTFSEREVAAWESVTRSLDASATADQWQSYAVALIDDGQLQRAQQVIDQVNSNPAIDQSRGANMLFCTALVQSAQGRQDEALESYMEVMTLTYEAYEQELESGNSPSWAIAEGVHDNYYLSATDRAAIYRDQERWVEGIEMLDLFLEGQPRSAGILVDRAYLKVQAGDLEGAEADYREALRFVPDFDEALEGLEEIGVGE